MKLTIIVAALAALSAAQPHQNHQHKRGLVCPAKSSYNKNTGAAAAPKPAPAVDVKPAPKPAQPTAAPAPPPVAAGPVCPNDGGKTLAGAGSCKCNFAVNCGARADYSTGAKFWERNKGEKIGSLAECVKICDDNA